MVKMNKKEQVYVLPANKFPPAGAELLCLEEALLSSIQSEGFFIPRDQAENDPSFRQIIPYALLAHQDKFFLMRRTRGGGEARLHNLFTIGVGGHINPEDIGTNPLLGGLRREIAEEVGVISYRARAVGLIVQDDNAVSQVHAGVVFLVEAHDEPRVAETDKLEGQLASLEQIHAVHHQLEDWSKIVLGWLDRSGSMDISFDLV